MRTKNASAGDGLLANPRIVARRRLKKPVSGAVGPHEFLILESASNVQSAEPARKPHKGSFAHRTGLLDRRTLLFAEKESSEFRAPGTGGCKGLILLHPFSEEFRRFPQKATCGWFWWHLLPPKGAPLRKGFYGLRNHTRFPNRESARLRTGFYGRRGLCGVAKANLRFNSKRDFHLQ